MSQGGVIKLFYFFQKWFILDIYSDQTMYPTGVVQHTPTPGHIELINNENN